MCVKIWSLNSQTFAEKDRAASVGRIHETGRNLIRIQYQILAVYIYCLATTFFIAKIKLTPDDGSALSSFGRVFLQ